MGSEHQGCMTHRMRLHPGPYERMRTGAKTIEIRLADEKRRRIHERESVAFTHRDDPDQQLVMIVEKIEVYPSFAELFRYVPRERLGLEADREGQDADSLAQGMRQYYSAEDEQRHGCMAIYLKAIQ